MLLEAHRTWVFGVSPGRWSGGLSGPGTEPLAHLLELCSSSFACLFLVRGTLGLRDTQPAPVSVAVGHGLCGGLRAKTGLLLVE